VSYGLKLLSVALNILNVMTNRVIHAILSFCFWSW